MMVKLVLELEQLSDGQIAVVDDQDWQSTDWLTLKHTLCE